MPEILTAACVQLNSGPDVQDNLKQAGAFIREAAGRGAQLIATPEVTDQVISNRAEKFDVMYSEEEHPGLPFFGALAQELGVHLLIGSMCVKLSGHKIANRSYLFDPAGRAAARYDKIHLFDVDLPNGESHRETALYVHGDKAVIADMGGVRLGMSVCYDLRFPYLYRDLAKARAQVLSIPAAFTVSTGQAHWEVLLRARAIETGSFVLAPAQSGDHDGARKTYGHSMIVGPWGEVLAHAETAPGIILAELNLGDVKKARQAIPALKHDRDYTLLGE